MTIAPHVSLSDQNETPHNNYQLSVLIDTILTVNSLENPRLHQTIVGLIQAPGTEENNDQAPYNIIAFLPHTENVKETKRCHMIITQATEPVFIVHKTG